MAVNHAGSSVSSPTTYESLGQLVEKAHEDLNSQAGRISSNINFLRNIKQTLLADGVVDDRKYIYEDIIALAASLPNGSGLREDLSGQFIKTLWHNLEHPPISYLGDEFKYRTADGSNNNIMYPQLGAGGSHYARSVTSSHLRTSTLPDPSLVFDTLLAREGPAREHPTKISSTLFYLGTIIIHDIFRTDDRDTTKVKSSSYLDLGPLYGHSADEQKQVRTFTDGLLKPDTFAEYRILGQPPGVAALLIAFNRFHNYIVREMAIINENGRFGLPDGTTPDSPGYADALLKRDNDLFQTGRLVTCGLYVNIILGDYLRTILNLNDNPVESDWKLDPREAFSNVFDSHGTPRGIGNQVSVEFNMIYRWHTAISNRDEAWAKGFLTEAIGPNIDASTLSVTDFLSGLQKWFSTQPRDPSQWTFGGIQRQKDGSFQDSDLVQLLQAGTETVAGAFGANNIPPVLKAVEVLGIQQGRQWGLATLNEFRRFFKLKPFSKFTEVNSDKHVAETLEALYGHPDNIELYPGLMAEEAKKPMSPASGLCPGFTISEAVLSDAVALVRGDRFYAVEYGPHSLTSFGFAAASSDPEVAGGGVMYKLLMRAFPGWYRANSVYALYPFNTPDRSREVLQKRGLADKVDFNPPFFIGPPTPIITLKGVVDLLHDQERFKVAWGPHTYQLTHHDYMLSGDAPSNTQQRESVKECLYRPQAGLEEVRRFYESITAELIQKNSHKLGQSYQIDIVKDIGNLAHATFTARFFDIPLQGFGDADGAYTDTQIYDVLAHLFEYVFLDLDTAKSLKHLVVATRETNRLAEVLQTHIADIKSPSLLQKFKSFMGMTEPNEYSVLSDYGTQLVHRLLEGGKSVDEVVWTIIPTAAAACATQAQAWAQLIDVYLSDKYYSHWPDIQKLAWSEDPEAFEKLKKYALEGFRLFPAASGVLRTVAVDTATITDGARALPVKKGDTIFPDFVTASLDPTKFPDPEQVKLDRPDELYIHHGWGPHSCLGRPIVTVAGASMLRAFARLTNVRRAPGPAGEMKRKLYNGAFPVFLAEDGSDWLSFPCAKKVLFDDFGAENSGPGERGGVVDGGVGTK